MTSREWHASGGATLAARPAPARTAAPGAERDLPSWEDLYLSLPTDQRAELLALADRQGLLHSHQLPTVDPALVLQRRQFFTQLVAGKVTSLPPLELASHTIHDDALDHAQREAVTRATFTPDACLIQGLPGSGKSRVAAEIVRQAIGKRERVLLLSATTTALDRVLEQLGPLPGLYALRSLHQGEKFESLPACVRGLTLAERTRCVAESAVQSARTTALVADEQVQRRLSQQSIWDEVAGVSQTLSGVRAKQDVLQARAGSLAEEARLAWEGACAPAEPGSFAALVIETLRQHGEHRQRIDALRKQLRDQELAALEAERATVTAQREELRPRVEAWNNGHWLSLSYWKVFFNKAVLEQMRELDARLNALQTKRYDIDTRLGQLSQDEKAAEETFEKRRQEVLRDETIRRQEQLQLERSALDTEANQLRSRLDQLGETLGTAKLSDSSAEVIAQSRQTWQAMVQREQAEADFAKRWATSLEAAAPSLAARLPGCANLIAATPASLATDQSLTGINFDLLLVDEADLIADPELLQAARRARRWVLIGEPEAAKLRSNNPNRLYRSTSVIPGLFQRLWHQLHVAPKQLPFRWWRNAERLCCRLRPVADDQRHWVECEPVADRPEFELCILSVPRQDPVLVEVRFPVATPVRQAKEFILRELQEAAAHAVGPAYLWSESIDQISVQMGGYPASQWDGRDIERVPLGDGVQEVIRTAPAAQHDLIAVETLGFTFARPTWDRPSATAWLTAHLGLKETGRTAYLGRLHRPVGELACFLSEALFRDGLTHAPQSETRTNPEIVAVPPLDRSERRRDSRPTSKLPPRGGAGLEIDLAANPSAERLAPDLRASLPRHGMVNHAEAIAVVEALESLLTHADFREEAIAWQKSRRPAGCAALIPPQGCVNGDTRTTTSHAPAIAVSALYDAQVQLIRLLMLRSNTLASAGLVHLGDGRFRLGDELEVIVETPPALRQRECLALLLSLTRSHATRAVALGEHPIWLPLALTRAAGRLMLFADVGTLHRRSQWTSAVDHLDETAAARECDLVMHLLRGVPEVEPQAASPPPLARPVRR